MDSVIDISSIWPFCHLQVHWPVGSTNSNTVPRRLCAWKRAVKDILLKHYDSREHSRLGYGWLLVAPSCLLQVNIKAEQQRQMICEFHQSQSLCQAVKDLLKSMAAQGRGSDLPWWSVKIWKGSLNLDIGSRRGATEHLANPRWFKPYRRSLVLAITLQMCSEPDHPGLVVNKEIALCLRHGSLNAKRNEQPMK